MRRPTVAELELPVTVWAARARPGFIVQPLQADRTPFDSTSDLWGRRAPLGLVLRNDRPHGDLESRFLLARVFHAGQEDDGTWWAFAYLSGLEPGWDARSIARAHERDELRRLRHQEVELYSSQAPALESQAVLDRLDT